MLTSGEILEKVVEYLQWHSQNAEREEFDIKAFERKIPPELALELCVAAYQTHGRRLPRRHVFANVV